MNKDNLAKLFLEEKKRKPELTFFYNKMDMSLTYITNEGKALKVQFLENNKEKFLYYPTTETKKKDSILVMELENNGATGVFEKEFDIMPKSLRDIATDYQFNREAIMLPPDRQQGNSNKGNVERILPAQKNKPERE